MKKKKLLLPLMIILLSGAVLAQTSVNDLAPKINNQPIVSEALFDLEFEYPVGVGGGEAGIETDGTNIYTTKWNLGGGFYRYQMDGTYIGFFTIVGATNVRDLAFDGTCFYGGAAGTSVFEMDFTPGAEVLISTITAPVDVRAIAYNEDLDVFYANNWGSNITCFNRAGTYQYDWAVGPTGNNYYGFAYDSYTPGSPYLWGYAQVGTTINELIQMQLPVGTETGLYFDVGSVVSGTSSAGGLAIDNNFVPGEWTFLGLRQNEYIWGLELISNPPITLPWIEDWEGVGPTTTFTSSTSSINGAEEWDYDKTANGRLRYTVYAHNGSQAAAVDANPNGIMSINYLTANLDISNYASSTDLELSFWHMERGDEPHSNDRVWIRGSNSDTWIEMYNLDGGSNGIWYEVTGLDIDAAISGAGQTITSTFQLRFGQEGNVRFNNDGRVFDDIEIYEFSCEPIPYSQDFEAGGAWPIDWSTDNANVWSMSTSWPGAAPPGGYHVYSDYTPYETGTVYSPCFDGSTASNINFRFYHYWKADYSGGSQDGYLYGSRDNGATWPYLIDEWHHNNPATEEGWKEYNISAWADGYTGITFKWEVSHNNDWYWVWDDFQIQEGPFLTPGLWTGVTSNDWDTGSNWDDGNVPDGTIDVVLPAGCPNYPRVNETATCNSLFIHDNANIITTVGADLTVGINIIVGQSITPALFTMNDGTVSCSSLGVSNSGFARINGGTLNCSDYLWVGFGAGGEFELNLGDVNISLHLLSHSGCTVDINGGTINFDDWRSNSSQWAEGTIELSGGTINAAGNVMYGWAGGFMDGPFTMTIGGTYRNWDDNWTTPTGGTVILTGTEGPGPHYCFSSAFGTGENLLGYNLNINASGVSYYLNPDSDVTGFVIENDFSVPAGFASTVNGAFDNDLFNVYGNYTVGTDGSVTTDVAPINVSSNFTVQSDASGTGSWLDNGNLTVTGTSAVERYITDNQWHFISSPVSNAVSNVFLGIYLKCWNEATYTWSPYISSTILPLNVGEGYEVWASSGITGSATVQYTGGTINTGNTNSTVTATDQNGSLDIGFWEGWNFVGNPFPSAVEWNTSWTTTNIDATIHVWNGFTGNYETWNHGSGVAPFGTMSNGIIPAGQGYYVKALDFNPAFTTPQSERLHSTKAFYKNGSMNSPSGFAMELPSKEIKNPKENNMLLYVNAKFETEPLNITEPIDVSQELNEETDKLSNILTLKVEGNNYSDKTLVLFNPETTQGMDNNYDAYKLEGLNEAPQLYSILPDINLTVNVLPSITSDLIVPLGFKIGVSGECTIIASELNSFDPSTTIFLEDLQESKMNDLYQNPTYTFNASPEDDVNRFLLHFSGPNSINETEIEDGIIIYSYENTIYVKSNNSKPFNGEIIVYNLIGQEEARKDFRNTSFNKVVINSPTGYYMVKVISDINTLTKKVFIK
ncbi:MAG: T9SS type A sorting domain-containing protein [Bacteroidales bacterium]|nr:T9SS type A sorting domain-containing protein [Bacteroidales bacterium]